MFLSRIVNLCIFPLLWLVGEECIILPNIRSISCEPLFSRKRTSTKETFCGRVTLCAIIAVYIWVVNQPTEHMALTKQFTEEVVSDKILHEMPQKQKEDIGIINTPDLEALMHGGQMPFSAEDEDLIIDSFMEQKYFSEEHLDKSLVITVITIVIGVTVAISVFTAMLILKVKYHVSYKQRLKIILLGDSITEKSTNPKYNGFHAMLQHECIREAYIINRSSSGRTTR